MIMLKLGIKIILIKRKILPSPKRLLMVRKISSKMNKLKVLFGLWSLIIRVNKFE